MKRLLLIQPGRFGDIIICLPIAKWYADRGYEVDWLCPPEYHSMFRNIDYCKPIFPIEYPTMVSDQYEKVIDLSFGIIAGSVHDYWLAMRPSLQSFVILKYQLAGVPLRERWNLRWTRDKKREDILFNMMCHGENYAIVQEKTWCYQSTIALFSRVDKILCEPVEDYNIFDWYLLLKYAAEIHCIDSSLCNFVEVIPDLMMKPKYYYQTGKTQAQADRTLLINNWRMV